MDKKNKNPFFQKLKEMFIDRTISFILLIIFAPIMFFAGLVGGTYSRAYTLVSDVQALEEKSKKVDEIESTIGSLKEDLIVVKNDIDYLKSDSIKKEETLLRLEDKIDQMFIKLNSR